MREGLEPLKQVTSIHPSAKPGFTSKSVERIPSDDLLTEIAMDTQAALIKPTSKKRDDHDMRNSPPHPYL